MERPRSRAFFVLNPRKGSAEIAMGRASSGACWLVGAMINPGDGQTDRFIEEGLWEHDQDDNSRVLALLRSIQTGERIAIKAADHHINCPSQLH